MPDTPAPTDPEHSAFTRLPALDGLRAVAVYLVVLFHAGIAQFESGFIGVDVFFVLSGFLITKLLIVERVRSGRIELLGFYARRIRRLLPAAWVSITATCVLFVAFASPVERTAVLRDARAAAFYVANWNFVDKGQDYFADSLESSPFLHLWSLAVEEQFYLVWPLVMLGLLAAWVRSAPAARMVTIGVSVAAAFSAIYAVTVADSNLIRAYYGTDTRAYQLLAGAAVAFALTTPNGASRRPLSANTAGGLVTVGVGGILGLSLFTTLGPVDRGVAVTLFTIVTVFGVAATTSTSGPARLLGVRPLVRLGDLSYATYLWHWPLIIILERTLQIRPRTVALVVILAATGLAKLSMDLLEAPIRQRSIGASRRNNIITVVVAVVATFALGLGVVSVVLQSDRNQIRAVDRIGFSQTLSPREGTPVPDNILDVSSDVAIATTTVTTPVDTAVSATPEPGIEMPAEPPFGLPVGANNEVVGDSFDEGDGCVNDDFDDAASCVVVSGNGQRVLLIGDSHANKMNVIFAEHALANDLSLATVSMVACPWQRGVLYEIVPPVEGARQVCRDQRISLYERVIEAYRPDVVVAISHDLTSERYQVVPSGDLAATDGRTSFDLIQSASIDSIADFTAVDARVVIMEPLPNAPFDTPTCLDAADFVEQCVFEVGAWPAPETAGYRMIADVDPLVNTVDITDLVCPAFPQCDPIIEGVLVRTDPDHLGLDFTRLIASDVMTRVGL
ncbi:MAG: peptidoglycan/LPS O-acetylase OafA/YrhL [Ilumatobacter sp.]|jgi:peptidoglycan/LPS O-acetylase OafA/YrhL